MMRTLLLLVALVAGCTSHGSRIVEEGRRSLDASAKVVTGFEGIAPEPVMLGEPMHFKLDQSASVLDDAAGRRFARAFRLPAAAVPLQVELASFLTGSFEEPAALYIEALVLDESNREVRKIAPIRLEKRQPLGRDALATQVFINDRIGKPSTLVITERRIHQSEWLTVDRDSRKTVTAYAPIGPVLVPIPFAAGRNLGATKLRAVPTGELELRVAEYRPVRIGGQ